MTAATEHDRTDVFEHFAGRCREIPWGTTGASLSVDCVMVRGRRAGEFRIAVKLGERWYNVGGVRADDPAIRELALGGQLIEYGPSPTQAMKQLAVEAAAEREDQQPEPAVVLAPRITRRRPTFMERASILFRGRP
jgi:hypothetical protein